MDFHVLGWGLSLVQEPQRDLPRTIPEPDRMGPHLWGLAGWTKIGRASAQLLAYWAQLGP